MFWNGGLKAKIMFRPLVVLLPRRKGPSMDDKGSCSFRHLRAEGCVLLSVVPVVHVGGPESIRALKSYG